MFQLKWLWKYMGKKRHLFVIGLFISVITSSLLIVNPMLSRTLIDEVITPQDSTLLIPILITMLSVQLGRNILRYVMLILFEKNSQQMIEEVRAKLFKVIQNEDYKFFGKIRTGDLMTRLTNDLELIRHATSWIAHAAFESILIFTLTIFFFFSVSVELTLWLLAVTPILFIITSLFSRIIKPMYRSLRQKLSDLNTVAQENIAGNRVVKAFAREGYEKERFDERNTEYRDHNLKATYVGVKFQPFIDFLSQSLTVITIFVGGMLMIEDSLTAGEMLAFSSLTWALANPLRTLGMIINDTQRFFASSNMIIEIFYSEPTIVDRSNAEDVKERVKGDIKFKDVNFKINGKEILTDINLHIKPGQTIGIMGPTGSGKTSLINMILRTYEPNSGKVFVDDKNANEYTLSSLRRVMGVAMQDVFLFSDSIDANIAYSNPDMDLDEVKSYAKKADAHEFIEKTSDGYDTVIGERGVGLSGGQKQRISLARALAVKPSILILDDTTSAVDMETEQYIQSQLKQLDYECTTIIIAQRVSSVQDANQIFVLEDGKIAQHGKHDDLVKEKGFYRYVWALQNSIEEGGE